MARPEPGAVVSMEILVEEDQVTPMWILLKLLSPSINWTTPTLISSYRSLMKKSEWATWLRSQPKSELSIESRHLSPISHGWWEPEKRLSVFTAVLFIREDVVPKKGTSLMVPVN
jgi:hypothetical protein